MDPNLLVRHSVKSESVQEIVNAPLLCEHNLLLYKPEDMNAPDNATRWQFYFNNCCYHLSKVLYEHLEEIELQKIIYDIRLSFKCVQKLDRCACLDLFYFYNPIIPFIVLTLSRSLPSLVIFSVSILEK